MAKATIFLSSALLYIFVSSHAQETALYHQPNTGLSAVHARESSTADYIKLYQKYVSGIRGHECPMYPSCSYYGLKTFTETNFVTAFGLTSDRLLRCGHDHKNYALTYQKGGFKLIDYPAYETPPADILLQTGEFHFAHSDTIKDNNSLKFIKTLINNEFYREALIEIIKTEIGSPFNPELFTNKLICFKAIGEYEKLIFEYELKCPEEYKQTHDIMYEVALAYYKLQNHPSSLKTDSVALLHCEACIFKAKFISLQALSYAHINQWNKSFDLYNSLSQYDSHYRMSLVNAETVKKAAEMRSRKPGLGAVMSVIPGLGYAYAGHTQTAVSALLVNALLTYATYTNFKTENYGMGILTGVFNLSFYLGNIYGAKKSVTRRNEQQKSIIIKQLEINSNL